MKSLLKAAFIVALFGAGAIGAVICLDSRSS